jgi:GTP cyclohydrolase I
MLRMNSWDRKAAEDAVTSLLYLTGHDIGREGLRETPKRIVKFWEEFSFQERIPFAALCEHHALPFFGHATVGYIPDKKIVGLSKLARAVNFFSRRFQNQERITRQVAEFLQSKLCAKGVGVHLSAEHTCMSIRGACAVGSKTSTVYLLGAMREDAATRAEFLARTR